MVLKRRRRTAVFEFHPRKSRRAWLNQRDKAVELSVSSLTRRLLVTLKGHEASPFNLLSTAVRAGSAQGFHGQRPHGDIDEGARPDDQQHTGGHRDTRHAVGEPAQNGKVKHER